MAGRKSVKSGNPEAVPVEMTEDPAAEAVTEVPAQEEKVFTITCRNNVSGMIGGVMFRDGVGYTRDGYSASWFANKDGYSVDSESERLSP